MNSIYGFIAFAVVFLLLAGGADMTSLGRASLWVQVLAAAGILSLSGIAGWIAHDLFDDKEH